VFKLSAELVLPEWHQLLWRQWAVLLTDSDSKIKADNVKIVLDTVR
jgi:hypothetical protein